METLSVVSDKVLAVNLTMTVALCGAGGVVQQSVDCQRHGLLGTEQPVSSLPIALHWRSAQRTQSNATSERRCRDQRRSRLGVRQDRCSVEALLRLGYAFSKCYPKGLIATHFDAPRPLNTSAKMFLRLGVAALVAARHAKCFCAHLSLFVHIVHGLALKQSRSFIESMESCLAARRVSRVHFLQVHPHSTAGARRTVRTLSVIEVVVSLSSVSLQSQIPCTPPSDTFVPALLDPETCSLNNRRQGSSAPAVS